MVRITGFKGKKVFITGGSSGIGLSTAREFCSRGAEVIISARDVSKLKKARSGTEGIIDSVAMDVSDCEAVFSTVERVVKEHGRMDIVVNSAGIVHPGILKDLQWHQITDMVDIDLLGTMAVCKAFSEKGAASQRTVGGRRAPCPGQARRAYRVAGEIPR